jgi:putative FmdB family regulatory protein
MPIYEYRCDDCGHQNEYLQKVSDAPLTTCPACGKATFSKMLSAAGFQLKGSGWYATDFKGGSKSAGGESKPAPAAPACGAGACSACST